MERLRFAWKTEHGVNNIGLLVNQVMLFENVTTMLTQHNGGIALQLYNFYFCLIDKKMITSARGLTPLEMAILPSMAMKICVNQKCNPGKQKTGIQESDTEQAVQLNMLAKKDIF